jgi:hypothetical protein
MTIIARDPLVSYCSELASLRDRDKRPPSLEYAEHTLRALTILARRYDPTRDRAKANPVWLDVDGAERAEALREAITAWEREETPPSLRGHRLLRLEYAAVMDGVDVRALNDWRARIRTRYPRQYDFKDLDRDPALAETFQRHMREKVAWWQSNVAYQRLLSVLHAQRAAQDAGAPVILYVDHLHRLFGGGGKDYPFDLATELKPLLSRCQIHLWGACTLTEYRATIEQDAAMQRRFQEILLPGVRACEDNATEFLPSKA